MKYTESQIRIALGIMSGRISLNPSIGWEYYGDLYNLSSRNPGEGFPEDILCNTSHRRKAEEILLHLLANPQELDPDRAHQCPKCGDKAVGNTNDLDPWKVQYL